VRAVLDIAGKRSQRRPRRKMSHTCKHRGDVCMHYQPPHTGTAPLHRWISRCVLSYMQLFPCEDGAT
jgi:hypothetical protein